MNTLELVCSDQYLNINKKYEKSVVLNNNAANIDCIGLR